MLLFFEKLLGKNLHTSVFRSHPLSLCVRVVVIIWKTTQKVWSCFLILNDIKVAAMAAIDESIDVIVCGESTNFAEMYPSAVECLHDILEEYVVESGWDFLPYKHFRYFRLEGQCGMIQIYLRLCVLQILVKDI